MGRNVSNTSFINFQQKLKRLKIISFLRLRPGSGGGEPQQPGAVCGRTGCQLRLHGLPQCDAEGDSGSGSLRRAAHHLSAGCHRTFPPTLLFPLPRPTQVCDSLCMFSKISWSRFHLQVFPLFLYRELRDDLPSPSLFQCFLPQPSIVTTVHLRRASGLSPPKQTGGSQHNTTSPSFFRDRRGQNKTENTAGDTHLLLPSK